MKIKLCTESKELFVLDIRQDMILGNFKVHCEMQSGLPAQEIVLVHNGRRLDDNRKCLKSLGIQDGDVVILHRSDASGSQMDFNAPDEGDKGEDQRRKQLKEWRTRKSTKLKKKVEEKKKIKPFKFGNVRYDVGAPFRDLTNPIYAASSKKKAILATPPKSRMRTTRTQQHQPKAAVGSRPFTGDKVKPSLTPLTIPLSPRFMKRERLIHSTRKSEHQASLIQQQHVAQHVDGSLRLPCPSRRQLMLPVLPLHSTPIPMQSSFPTLPPLSHLQPMPSRFRPFNVWPTVCQPSSLQRPPPSHPQSATTSTSYTTLNSNYTPLPRTLPSLRLISARSAVKYVEG